jgi:hypothetical protein
LWFYVIYKIASWTWGDCIVHSVLQIIRNDFKCWVYKHFGIFPLATPWTKVRQHIIFLALGKTDLKHVQYNFRHYGHRIKRIWKSLFEKIMNTKAIHDNKICWKGNLKTKDNLGHHRQGRGSMPKCGIHDYKNLIICAIYDYR